MNVRPHKTLEKDGVVAMQLTEGEFSGIIFSYGRVSFEEKPEEVPEESTIDDVSESAEDSVEEDQAKDVDMDEKKRKEEEKREQNRIAKRRQTEAQRKTFEENKSKGINPYDMLTKVNLEKWLIKEERTYADIAQNIVGCSDKDVSLAAKRFDVKSKYIGENGMIKAGRKKKKVSAVSE